MAQITPRTAGLRRGPGKPWRKGQSGNPGGQPKGLLTLIRSETKDGKEIAAYMLRVLRGQREGAKASDEIEAVKWLADRGWGRPAQTIEPIGAGQQEPPRR